jgi:cellulose synthase/poly-beta-1,6-N-acetylglucosamine synthase-like glycosyltransferase
LRPVAATLALGRAVLAVLIGYLSVLTVAAWVASLVGGRRRRPGSPTTRFALVVPAHDEEVVIADTLAAMAALDYPAELRRVHVVADHCSDRTVAIATAAGVEVHEHVGTARGKGPALQWALAPLVGADDAEAAADAFVIVDADTVVAPGFLRALDREFAAGAAAVQGQYRVREPGGSTGAGLRAAALALRHHLRPLGRTALGASSGLYGNGMAFTADVLRRREWTDHLTEDMELQMELLLDGTLVRYAPDAVVEAEMPATLEGAATQNERWEQGRIDLARRYVPRLARLAAADPRRRIAAVDGMLDHLVPPLSVLAAATGGVAVAGSAVSVARGTGWRRSGWVLCAALGAHVVSGLLLARAPWSVWRALAHAPAMVVWKVRLWARMLVRPGSVGWVRTARAGAEGSDPT